MHFIDGNLNAESYCGRIPEALCCAIHDNKNALPHDARIYMQFLQAAKKTTPVLALPASSPNMSPIEFGMIRIGVFGRVFTKPLKRNRPATIDNLIIFMQRRCLRTA